MSYLIEGTALKQTLNIFLSQNNKVNNLQYKRIVKKTFLEMELEIWNFVIYSKESYIEQSDGYKKRNYSDLPGENFTQ